MVENTGMIENKVAIFLEIKLGIFLDLNGVFHSTISFKGPMVTSVTVEPVKSPKRVLKIYINNNRENLKTRY